MSTIVVPQDPAAPDEAKEEVAELSALFGPEALARRLAILDAAAPPPGLSLADDSITAKVRRSMTWGTATEVALRLLEGDLDADKLAQLDALAVAVRISRGLAERRYSSRHPLIGELVAVARRIGRDLDLSPDLLDAHEAALARLHDHAFIDRMWTTTEVVDLIESLPLRLALRACAEIRGVRPDDRWSTRVGSHYAPCHYLALDLRLMAAPIDGTSPLISPSTDGCRLVDRQLADPADVVYAVLPLLDSHAAGLHAEIAVGTETGMPAVALDYAQTALGACAGVYAALAHAGLIRS